jgi:hypothetical protein
VRLGPPQLVEELARFSRDAERERRAGVAIPRAHERLADALSIAFGRHERVGAPGTFDLDAAKRYAYWKGWIVADDRRPFASDPDAGLTCGVIGIASMLPVPSEPAGFGRVRSVRAAIQRLDAPTVLGPEAIDL